MLDKHAQLKKKLIRANATCYKEYPYGYYETFRIGDQVPSKPTEDTLKAWKKQKNYCSNLYKSERKKYY